MGSTNGEDNPASKLTEEQVRTIRRQAREGTPHAQIAREMGVVPQTVSDIVLRNSWRQVGARDDRVTCAECGERFHPRRARKVERKHFCIGCHTLVFTDSDLQLKHPDIFKR